VTRVPLGGYRLDEQHWQLRALENLWTPYLGNAGLGPDLPNTVDPGGNDGVLSGGIDWGTAAEVGWGILFSNTTTEFVDCSPIDWRGRTALTATAWMTWDGSGTNEHTIISNWGGAQGDAQLLLRLEPAGDFLEVFVNQDASNANVNATDLVVPTDGSWHHVGMVYDHAGDGLLKVYVDGVESTITAATTAGFGSNQRFASLELGRSPQTSGRDPLGGQLGEVRVYGRALLADEMWQLWAPQTRHDLYARQVVRVAAVPSVSVPLIAQYKSLDRGVFSRVGSRVN